MALFGQTIKSQGWMDPIPDWVGNRSLAMPTRKAALKNMDLIGILYHLYIYIYYSTYIYNIV